MVGESVYRKFVVRAVAITAVLLLFAAPMAASAAGEDSGVNLTTSPLPINIVAAPGETKTVDLKIKNSGSKAVQLRVDLMKFKAFGEEGKPRLLDREPGDDYFDWVSFSEKTFNAEPGVWKSVKMTIKVPRSASSGYYYAAVFSPANKPKPTSERTAAVVGATATLVLLEARVPGAKRAIEVVEFSADRKFYEYLPASFSIKLRNKGNVHVAPYGSIFMSRGDTKDISIIGVNSEKGNILPDSNRVYTASWQDGFPVYQPRRDGPELVADRSGKAAQVLKWDFTQVPKLRIGKYTASMLLVYDDGQRDVPVEAVVSFWVIPWRLILLMIAVPVIPAALVYFIMRRRMRRKTA